MAHHNAPEQRHTDGHASDYGKTHGNVHDSPHDPADFRDESGFLMIFLGLVVMAGMTCLPATIAWVTLATAG